MHASTASKFDSPPSAWTNASARSALPTGTGPEDAAVPLGASRPAVSEAELGAAAADALAPLERDSGENPYTVHSDMQQTMSDLVGIIRREEEIKKALAELEGFRARATQVKAEGGRAYNPGWHLAMDLRNMMQVAECVAQAALERQESRGGHTREDYPEMSPEWRKVNLICSLEADGNVALTRQPMVAMREDLLQLFDVGELKKYMTDEELTGLTASSSVAKAAGQRNGVPSTATPAAIGTRKKVRD